MRPTSHVASAQPAPVKNPTQAQTTISSTLTFVGILISPCRNVAFQMTAIDCAIAILAAVFALPPLIVVEIRRAGEATIARSMVRTARGRSRCLGTPSRAARIVKLVGFAGAAYAADCGHALLQSLETAVGCAAPAAAIHRTPWIRVVRRRLRG